MVVSSRLVMVYTVQRDCLIFSRRARSGTLGQQINIKHPHICHVSIVAVILMSNFPHFVASPLYPGMPYSTNGSEIKSSRLLLVHQGYVPTPCKKNLRKEPSICFEDATVQNFPVPFFFISLQHLRCLAASYDGLGRTCRFTKHVSFTRQYLATDSHDYYYELLYFNKILLCVFVCFLFLCCRENFQSSKSSPTK